MATKTKKETPEQRAAKDPTVQKVKARMDKAVAAVDTITAQVREFSVGGENKRTLKVRFPKPIEEQEVSQTYSKMYGKLLLDPELMPEDQLLAIMEERGIWDPKNDKMIEDLSARLGRLSAQLLDNAENMTADELTKTTEDFNSTEDRMDDLANKRRRFTANSIENKCFDVKIRDQIWRCVSELTKDEDGKVTEEKPVWNSLEEVSLEEDVFMLLDVISNCLTFWQGVPVSFLDDSLETPDGDSDTQ